MTLEDELNELVGEFKEDAAKRASAGTNDSQWGKFVKNGETVVRFLPPEKGSDTIFHTVYRHEFIKGADGKNHSFVCPEKSGAGKCPVCEKCRILSTSTNPLDRKAASAYEPRQKNFCVAIDVSEEVPKPRIYQIPWSVFSALADQRTSAHGGDYTHHQDGFNMIVTKKGDGINTKYTVSPARSCTPLAATTEEMVRILKERPKISEILSVQTYDEMTARLTGATEKEEEEMAPSSLASDIDTSSASLGDIPF